MPEGIAMDREFVIKALLQQNYLPRQNRWLEEVPPRLSSSSFSKAAAIKLTGVDPRQSTSFLGHDSVTYRLTRFSGVPRVCSIPHPRAYAHLALNIHKNWNHLEYITKNENSKIHPFEHLDGRIAIIAYPDPLKNKRSPDHSFGKRFVVCADVSNFYPSIYSHSISWATVGFNEAKENRRKKTWYNELDAAVRLTKRGETQGVAIGPATSSIIAEVILARVDAELRDDRRDFTFVRYIDDYVAYCETEEEGRAFILQLTHELDKYKLVLNVSKTEILPLPCTRGDPWVTELVIALPESQDEEVSVQHAVEYVNLAVRLDKQWPNGSVLKYALKALSRQRLDYRAMSKVLQYAVNLSFHQPVLLPLLEGLFDAVSSHGNFEYCNELQQLLYEHSRFNRSDAVSWALYLCSKHEVAIQDKCAEQIIRSGDCIPILFLYLFGTSEQQAKVVSFATNGLDRSDLYELDRYWLLLYQLFLDGKIANPYDRDDTFDVMRGENVNFVTEPEIVARKPLGQWLIENMPRGVDIEIPDRSSSREIPFIDDEDQ